MSEPFLRCPKDWTMTTLEPDEQQGFITEVSTGSTPRTDNPEFWDGNISWLTPKELSSNSNGIYVWHTERTLTPLGLANCSAPLMPPGTVMLTKRAPVGYVAVNAVPMATNQGFLAFTCGPGLRPAFLAYWLKVNKPYLDIVANGSTYPELYVSDLFEFQASVPNLELQDTILSAIRALEYSVRLSAALEYSASAFDSMVDSHKQAEELRCMRDTMLPLLISGHINPMLYRDTKTMKKVER